MSKYTTEVRYICEVNAGLTESKGYDDVETIIANSRTKIFNFSYPIYDEAYRSVLETKILKHFYTREIGFETVGIWKLKLDTKLNEIMPYYNQLYKSTLLEFNPLWTEDWSREGNRASDGNAVNVSENDNVTIGQEHNATDTINIAQGNAKESNVRRDKYADTPQGSISDLEDDKYLTNARKITEDNNSDNSNLQNNTSIADNSNVTNNNNKATNNNVFANTEDYLESVQGRRGKDVSELILNYRKTFLNIDMQIIDDLEELFIHLW